MATNDIQSLLDGLLFTAQNKWDMPKEQIMEQMNKIAFHESKYGTEDYLSAQEGGGPGRGMFQFERNVEGEGQGAAHTAINRLIAQLNIEEMGIPKFVSEIRGTDYDVSELSPQEQQILFLGNLLQKPDRKDKEGNIISKAGFYDTDGDGVHSDAELANLWATHHQAGTTPGTDEYDAMINTFTEDLGEGYRKGLIER